MAWETIVSGYRSVGHGNQIISLIAYILYKKFVEEKNLMHSQYMSTKLFVKKQLSDRKCENEYCPRNASIVIEMTNIILNL